MDVPLIVVIVGVILLQIFLWRRRKPETTHREVAQGLLAEVRLNQALVEVFPHRQKPKKFEVTSWRRNKTKLDFLKQSIQSDLSSAYDLAEDFNHQIEVAKKYKSTSYMISLDTDKLKEPMTKSRQGLEEWLLVNVGRTETPPKYPGIFDGLFGGRG